LLVESHTDNDPMKGFASNWDLSSARATAVVRLLTSEGKWPAAQIRAAGCAEARPVVPNDTKENKALNRRIELRFSLPKG
jgi:chemotaxis protein MotB